MSLPVGAGNAVVTPFDPADGGVDHLALSRLVDWQITEGIDFLVACGSTGEAQTLTAEERQAVVVTVVAAANGRVPVLAGVTDNATPRAVAEAIVMSRLGVAGIMSASPYYNKPTQAGLVAHFTAIADAIEVPLLLYNVPGRSAVDMRPETVATLSRHSRIAGIKEASGSTRRILDLVRMTSPDFIVHCGDDDVAVPAIAAGAQGLISVAGNAIPRTISTMIRDARAGRFGEASATQRKLLPFIDALFAEANPIPVKTVLAMLKYCAADVRLPLVPASEALRVSLKALLSQMEVTDDR